MKILKIVLTVLVAIAIVVIAGLFLIGYFKPKPGGLMVDTTPSSSVYIDGDFVGKTPYKGTKVAGQISLKLVPDIADQNLIAYETKVNLIPGVQTVVGREFGTSEDNSSGVVISFDKIKGGSAGLVVISTPDNSQVLVDGIAQGFSPYSLDTITSGSHQITVEMSGYTDRTMSVKTQPGYRLTVFIKLAKSQEILPSPSPSPSPAAAIKTYVLIGNTPTGFLRMRTEAGTKGEEIAELKPGSKYLFLEGDISTGWYKIQYQDPVPGLPTGITGWVSNQFAQLSTESGTLKNN